VDKKQFISLLEKKLDNINPSEGSLKNSIESIIYFYTISLIESKEAEELIWHKYKPILFESCDKYLLMHECRLSKENISEEIREDEKAMKKELNNTLKYAEKNDNFAALDSYMKYLECDVAIAKKQSDLLSIIANDEKIDYRTLSEFKELANYMKVLYFPFL
jgi:hypothetical protein